MPTYGPTTTPTVEVTATTQQMVVNTKYYANNASTRITFALPVVSKVGDQVFVRGQGAAGWRITQTGDTSTGQMINGNTSTTRGSAGYIESQTADDTVTLERLAGASDIWKIINPRGTLTYG